MFTRPVESQGVPSPTIFPSSGSILSSQTIIISIGGSAVSAEYSFDNSTWVAYTSPFTLSSDTTVYARALDAGGNYSDVVSNSYTIRIYDAQVEYLQSTGTQYINTGIVLTQRNYELEMDMKWSGSTVSTFESFIGFMASGTTPRSGFHKYQSKWMFGTNATTSSGIAVDSNRHTFAIKSYETNTEELYEDGTLIKSGRSSSTGISTNTMPYYIFARNRGTSVDNKAYYILYSLKFKTYLDNSHTTLATEYDFIPVRIGTTGYMYDKVSRQLFGNNGSGDFILGNDVAN